MHGVAVNAQDFAPNHADAVFGYVDEKCSLASVLLISCTVLFRVSEHRGSSAWIHWSIRHRPNSGKNSQLASSFYGHCCAVCPRCHCLCSVWHRVADYLTRLDDEFCVIQRASWPLQFYMCMCAQCARWFVLISVIEWNYYIIVSSVCFMNLQ